MLALLLLATAGNAHGQAVDVTAHVEVHRHAKPNAKLGLIFLDVKRAAESISELLN